MNPSGQAVVDQLGLPGDRATTPAQYEMQSQWPTPGHQPESNQSLPQHLYPEPPSQPDLHESQHVHPPQYFHLPSQSNLAPPQTQGHQLDHTHQHHSHLYKPPSQPGLRESQHITPTSTTPTRTTMLRTPQIQGYQLDPSIHSQSGPGYLPDHAYRHRSQLHFQESDEGVSRAGVGTIASTYALMQHEGPMPPAQLNLGGGSNSEWGVTRLVALAPYHLGENVQGERMQGVIRTKSHVSDATIPQDASGGQHQMRLPPNPDPSPAIPQARGSTRISLSTEMERKYKELAKEKLCALILNIAADTDGAPETAMRDEMIDKALRTAEVELFGQEKIKELKGIHNTMVASLAEMRRSFKVYAMNVVHLGYDLRPPLFSSIDKAAHKQGKIPELLEGLRYLESLEKGTDRPDIQPIVEF
ncbi:hypothetical protein M405DRAFT_869357 [Rhizopogon salebrosus TDB-379]|nr:hypothetical protein M405DRAFT_869357 [Rhizopogon salebrosus TDB-379]